MKGVVERIPCALGLMTRHTMRPAPILFGIRSFFSTIGELLQAQFHGAGLAFRDRVGGREAADQVTPALELIHLADKPEDLRSDGEDRGQHGGFG